MSIDSNQIVYVLTNPAMPGLIKIGMTTQMEVEDNTDAVEKTIEADTDAADKQSAEVMKEARRPRMNFHELGIPSGSVLVYKDGSRQATVTTEKKVMFEGQECSLTAATRCVMGLPKDYAIHPSPHWTLNGKSLHEIYDDTHSGQE